MNRNVNIWYFYWPLEENYFSGFKPQFIRNVVWSNLREVKWGSCFGFNDTNILAAVRTCLCGTLIITKPQPQNWDQTPRLIICEIWQSSKSNLRFKLDHTTQQRKHSCRQQHGHKKNHVKSLDIILAIMQSDKVERALSFSIKITECER